MPSRRSRAPSSLLPAQASARRRISRFCLMLNRRRVGLAGAGLGNRSGEGTGATAPAAPPLRSPTASLRSGAAGAEVSVGDIMVECMVKNFLSPATLNYLGKVSQEILPQGDPYLVDAPDVVVTNRGEPICKVPPMRFGSMPRDGGHLIFTDDEAKAFLKEEPGAKKWIRPYTGA